MYRSHWFICFCVLDLYYMVPKQTSILFQRIDEKVNGINCLEIILTFEIVTI